jgi:hypothetical protein
MKSNGAGRTNTDSRPTTTDAEADRIESRVIARVPWIACQSLFFILMKQWVLLRSCTTAITMHHHRDGQKAAEAVADAAAAVCNCSRHRLPQI